MAISAPLTFLPPYTLLIQGPEKSGVQGGHHRQVAESLSKGLNPGAAGKGQDDVCIRRYLQKSLHEIRFALSLNSRYLDTTPRTAGRVGSCKIAGEGMRLPIAA